jgi:predicted lipoprotein
VVARLSHLLALALALGSLAGCERDPDPPVDDGFDRAAMLTSFVDEVAQPALDTFAASAADLAAAAEAYRDGGDKAQAEAAYTAAIQDWQHLEVYQVGPIGRLGFTTGGGLLHDEIYSWPEAVSACAVDQQLVANEFTSPTFFEDKLVDAYGLDALEYLLFAEGATNQCASAAAINSSGDWDALVASGDLEARRAAYAAAVAVELSANATALQVEMVAYRDALIGAGEGDSEYGNAQEAIDDLFAALYYLELRVKDRKLAVPLGLHISCAAERCPEDVEARWSRYSMTHVANNLAAGLRLYQGGDGVGFDDMLLHFEADDLAARFEGELIAAREAASAYTSFRLQDGVVDDPAGVQAVHDAIKNATDTMKSELVTVLNLRVPQEGAGDND